MKPYRKFPPDLDGLGWFIGALVVFGALLVILRIT